MHIDWSSLGLLPERRVVVGVSGGVDSVVLLHLLAALRAEGGIAALHAAHFEHGIRGAESEADARFVEALAASLGVDCRIGRGDVPAEAKARKEGLEETARSMRYAFLEAVREEVGADYIATAHHADDQAETVLLHLLRGTGLSGLGGMRPVSGRIVRPLLSIPRAEIEAYAREHDLPHREDATNALPDSPRNRIRLALLPLLAREYNPNIRAGLLRLSRIAAEEDGYLQGEAARICERIRDGAGGYCLELVRSLPKALQARVAREMLREQDALYDATEALIARLAALFSARTGAKLPIREGLMAWVSYDRLRFGAGPEPTLSFSLPFVREGEMALPGGGRMIASRAEARIDEGAFVAYLDLDRIPEDAVVRTREPGDRFHPLGAPGAKKLKEYFIDRKLPREARNVPLLASGARILFVPGGTVAEEARVLPATKRLLRVEYARP